MPLGAPLVDDSLNLYLHDSAGDIMKFSQSGALIWRFSTGQASPLQPALWNGILACGVTPGTLLALDMETGTELWRNQVALDFSGSGSSITAYDGIGLVTSWLPPWQGSGGDGQVVAFSVQTGGFLWNFAADGPIYGGVVAVLEESRLAVFSDQFGCAYGLALDGGREVWRNCAHRHPHTFSAGSGALGSNGIFYAPSNAWSGCLHAVNASDGATVWFRQLPASLHATPGIGRLRPGSGLSVVVGLGDGGGPAPALTLEKWVPPSWKSLLNRLSVGLGDWSRFLWWIRPYNGHRLHLVALDAASGADQWWFETPPRWRPTCAGNEERVASWLSGMKHEGPETCACGSWGSPSIGADGTIFVGNAHGTLYALKDEDGDGLVRGDGEVSSADLGAAIHMPASIAPGMLAAVTCDEAVIFRS